MSFKNKLVAIVNKDIDAGVAMNAIAHASLAIGATLGKEEMFLQENKDASGNNWPMSGMPYIILRGKSVEIRKAVLAAKAEDVRQIAFVETMTGGTWLEQVERTSKIKEDDHIYFVAILYGSWDTVSQISKKFSLYK
jgi:hypothetical protein